MNSRDVETLRWALAGYTIGITGHQRWEEQAEMLSRRGARVVHGPTTTDRVRPGHDVSPVVDGLGTGASARRWPLPADVAPVRLLAAAAAHHVDAVTFTSCDAGYNAFEVVADPWRLAHAFEADVLGVAAGRTSPSHCDGATWVAWWSRIDLGWARWSRRCRAASRRERDCSPTMVRRIAGRASR